MMPKKAEPGDLSLYCKMSCIFCFNEYTLLWLGPNIAISITTPRVHQ